MTMTRINRSKLPTKYALEVYKMVDGYPSTIDLLYEIVTVLEDRDKLDQAFQPKDILKEVSTRFEGEDLEQSLPKLVNEGWLTIENDNYTLAKHPWS